MRVFIGLIEIAGRYKALKHGFDKLGVPATLGLIHYNEFYSKEWSEYFIIRLFQFLYRTDALAAHLPRWLQYPTRGPIRMVALICKLPLFIWALAKHDIFIFGSFSNFFYGYSYPILKLFRKKIIFQFHGSDSRPPYLDGRYQEVTTSTINACIRLTRITKKKLRWVEKYATAIVNSPPQGYFHERAYINRLLIGIPCGPFEDEFPRPYEDSSYKIRNGTDQAVRILHAPSDRAFKGTVEIRKIIQKLKNQGLKIEYNEISSVTNIQVIHAIKACDLVVDQLFVDFAMPGLASEAAYYAKPTVLAGNSKDLWDHLLAEKDKPPTAYCKEEEFEENIKQLILHPEQRANLGLRAQNFVRKNWSPEIVASNYLKVASGNFPKEWLIDPWQTPTQIVGGFFKPKIMAQKMVSEIIARDKSLLQLDDKPHLIEEFSKFARGDFENSATH